MIAMLNNLDQTITLKDGRTLCYAEVGVPDGKPIFLFHGSPGSRLDVKLDESLATHDLAARFIVPDRPGIGRSDFQKQRTIADWPQDVVELADALHLESFSIIGLSGGGPYAAACARFIPQRLRSVALVSSICPLQVTDVTAGMGQGRLFFTLARWSPRLAGWMFGSMKPALQKNPDAVRQRLIGSFSAPDRAFFSADPRIAKAFLASLAESMRQGSFGLGWDAHLLSKPWNFQLADIDAPVVVWHGCLDTNAPVAMGKYLAQTIPHARSRYFSDEGHISLLKHLPELIASL